MITWFLCDIFDGQSKTVPTEEVMKGGGVGLGFLDKKRLLLKLSSAGLSHIFPRPIILSGDSLIVNLASINYNQLEFVN